MQRANENKHCREIHVLCTNRQEIPAYCTVLCKIFRVGPEKVLYRSCLPQWKQERSGSQLLLSSREVSPVIVKSGKLHVSEQGKKF